ncbi:MAG: DUF4212 domain-containing protein [Holophagales bacterium]|jgi:putative solute:sodium symporter small subunit|nr:MAG: DUF4212 domain-containing protein [Holophagales bacterium]
MRVRELEPDRGKLAAYWRATRRLTAGTLAVWAAVSVGAALMAETLNRIVVGGFPLGYYFGAQGSVLVFVLLVANYARAMNRLDRQHELQEDEE